MNGLRMMKMKLNLQMKKQLIKQFGVLKNENGY